MSETTLTLSGHDLTLADLVAFDAERPRAVLSEAARGAMRSSVDTLAEVVRTDRTCYGVNTGFGAFANRRISNEDITQLQYNLVRSHTCGVGAALPARLVRRIMLLKANSLAHGCSGIRAEVVDTLLELLNHDVLPVIPARGSVGARSDDRGPAGRKVSGVYRTVMSYEVL